MILLLPAPPIACCCLLHAKQHEKAVAHTSGALCKAIYTYIYIYICMCVYMDARAFALCLPLSLLASAHVLHYICRCVYLTWNTFYCNANYRLRGPWATLVLQSKPLKEKTRKSLTLVRCDAWLLLNLGFGCLARDYDRNLYTAKISLYRKYIPSVVASSK